MGELTFDTPLVLRGRVVVRTLDDAADFVRRYRHAQRPVMQDGLLRKLERADAPDEQRIAADAFRAWVEAEGLLVEPV
jgi:hypothetical protein